MKFHKYQGAGNDFVIIDATRKKYSLSKAVIEHICNRRFGVGADGLMLIEEAEGYDFRMVYYNADGNESTMCGNGGRCIVKCAQMLGMINEQTSFIAIDGAHDASILPDGSVALAMTDVAHIQLEDSATIMDTGSPHYVTFCDEIKHINVEEVGRDIRNQERFAPAGLNVNFIKATGDMLEIRTYERGVEAETLACGTGVTAAAIASTCQEIGHFVKKVKTLGGDLEVRFEKKTPTSAQNITLLGPAQHVFTGVWEL